MKLFYDKKSKDPTYYAQQGIRNGKKTTTRNVKNLVKVYLPDSSFTFACFWKNATP